MESAIRDVEVVGDGDSRIRRLANAFLAILSFCVACTGCERTPGSLPQAYPKPINNGTLVLVRQSNEFGAFILMNQEFVRATNPVTGRTTGRTERMDYAWFLRKDGKGLLSPTDPAVTSGVVTGATRIAFGGFLIGWSGSGRGTGWVYYAETPFISTGQPSFEMCPTTETNLSGIDGSDPKWSFRHSPPMDSKAWKTFFGDGIDRSLFGQ
jgi:hypothetical protein